MCEGIDSQYLIPKKEPRAEVIVAAGRIGTPNTANIWVDKVDRKGPGRHGLKSVRIKEVVARSRQRMGKEDVIPDD